MKSERLSISLGYSDTVSQRLMLVVVMENCGSHLVSRSQAAHKPRTFHWRRDLLFSRPLTPDSYPVTLELLQVERPSESIWNCPYQSVKLEAILHSRGTAGICSGTRDWKDAGICHSELCTTDEHFRFWKLIFSSVLDNAGDLFVVCPDCADSHWLAISKLLIDPSCTFIWSSHQSKPATDPYQCAVTIVGYAL